MYLTLSTTRTYNHRENSNDNNKLFYTIIIIFHPAIFPPGTHKARTWSSTTLSHMPLLLTLYQCTGIILLLCIVHNILFHIFPFSFNPRGGVRAVVQDNPFNVLRPFSCGLWSWVKYFYILIKSAYQKHYSLEQIIHPNTLMWKYQI